MMFIKRNILIKKLTNLCYMIFNRLENNDNPDIETNGEKIFLINFIQYLKKTSGYGIIFDVGANIGNYTNTLLELSNLYSLNLEIHLFEPLKSSFLTLKNKFASQENIILNNFGLSDEIKKTEIFYDEEKSGLASLYKRHIKHFGIDFKKSEIIMLKRADEYIQEKAVKHINLLKIDVEGHEYYVLKGFGEYLNADFIDFIQFEYGGTWLDSHTTLKDVYFFLEERGFKIAKILKGGLELRPYHPYMENFQYANYVAISEKIIKYL